MRILNNLLQFLLKSRRMNRNFRRACLALSCVVIFSTTYALLLPAITLDEPAAEQMEGIYLEDSDNGDTYDVGVVEEDEPEYYEEEPFDDSENQDFYEDVTYWEDDSAAQQKNADEWIENNDEFLPEIHNEPVKELTAVANGIEVRITFDEAQDLPEGTALDVRLIDNVAEPNLYGDYYDRAISEMAARDLNTIRDARFFVLSANAGGEKVELTGDAKVTVIFDNAYDVEGTESVQILAFYADRTDEFEPLTYLVNGTESFDLEPGRVTGFAYMADRFDQVAVGAIVAAGDVESEGDEFVADEEFVWEEDEAEGVDPEADLIENEPLGEETAENENVSEEGAGVTESVAESAEDAAEDEESVVEAAEETIAEEEEYAARLE